MHSSRYSIMNESQRRNEQTAKIRHSKIDYCLFRLLIAISRAFLQNEIILFATIDDLKRQQCVSILSTIENISLIRLSFFFGKKKSILFQFEIFCPFACSEILAFWLLSPHNGQYVLYHHPAKIKTTVTFDRSKERRKKIWNWKRIIVSIQTNDVNEMKMTRIDYHKTQ